MEVYIVRKVRTKPGLELGRTVDIGTTFKGTNFGEGAVVREMDLGQCSAPKKGMVPDFGERSREMDLS